MAYKKYAEFRAGGGRPPGSSERRLCSPVVVVAIDDVTGDSPFEATRGIWGAGNEKGYKTVAAGRRLEKDAASILNFLDFSNCTT